MADYEIPTVHGAGSLDEGCLRGSIVKEVDPAAGPQESMEGSKDYKRPYRLNLKDVVVHIGGDACGPVHANLSWDLYDGGQQHRQTTAPDGDTHPRIRPFPIAIRDQGSKL